VPVNDRSGAELGVASGQPGDREHGYSDDCQLAKSHDVISRRTVATPQNLMLRHRLRTWVATSWSHCPARAGTYLDIPWREDSVVKMREESVVRMREDSVVRMDEAASQLSGR
jgi:hypothetical protein